MIWKPNCVLIGCEMSPGECARPLLELGHHLASREHVLAAVVLRARIGAVPLGHCAEVRRGQLLANVIRAELRRRHLGGRRVGCDQDVLRDEEAFAVFVGLLE